jgi:NADH oxidase (H2O2-forming)
MRKKPLKQKRMKVVVIGNGIGGFSAASNIRRLDDQCDISIISNENHPIYSACVLPDYISGEIPRERVFVKSMEDYEKLGIRTIFGDQAKEVDPIAKMVCTERDETVSFDKLVLATGSRAVILGGLKKGVFNLKTLQDADEILRHGGKKVVVIGAGPIGIEVGIALSHRGYRVSILEMMDHVLPLGLDALGANKVKAILKEHEIEVFNSERCESVRGTDQVTGVVTNRREIECDTLVWAVGMRPSVDLAAKSGIRVGDKGGICVNPRMETSVPDIYACGDCIESNDILTGEPYPNLFWHNANRQGAVAARNCAGLPTNYPGSHNLLNVDVFGNHVAGFGFTEAAVKRFRDLKAFEGNPLPISIVEREKNGSYYRLVMAGDRCMGAQFLNIDLTQRVIGLIWSFMLQKRSVEGLRKVLEDERLLSQKPWLRRMRPLFMGGRVVG